MILNAFLKLEIFGIRQLNLNLLLLILNIYKCYIHFIEIVIIIIGFKL